MKTASGAELKTKIPGNHRRLASDLQKAESEILSVVSETVIIKEHISEKPPDDMEKTQRVNQAIGGRYSTNEFRTDSITSN
jgi:hypothetical protein